MPVVVGDTQADGEFAHLHILFVSVLRILGHAIHTHTTQVLKMSGLF